jgi:L-aspartate oxidase
MPRTIRSKIFRSNFARYRYLLPFRLRNLPQLKTDVLIIGSGSAGLRAAIEAARGAEVIIVTKRKRTDANSFYAQGGIAAAISREDTLESHIHDTVQTGWGLAERDVVSMVVKEGLGCIQELIRWGARFDRYGQGFDLAREGGHGFPRILHKGDETGAELEATLLKVIDRLSNVRLLEETFVIDLITHNNISLGALVCSPFGDIKIILAKRTILASGGTGQLYRETTNAPVSTGDGIAMAARAGAHIEDIEFIQFHPTTLYIAGASRALISESVRGEGARLVDKTGNTFMRNYHPMGDLAPRDIVSRAILHQMRLTDDTQVYLDLTHLSAKRVRSCFPTLWDLCNRFGLNISRDLIPVRPSAHYMIGGVKIDEFGRTSVRNLYACGEVAASSFHGANRLASNSLLECLVFGKRSGLHAIQRLPKRWGPPKRLRPYSTPTSRMEIDIDDMRNSIKSLLWRHVGIERGKEGLEATLKKLGYWAGYTLERMFDTIPGWELQNMIIVGGMIAYAALQRQESRGVHYRSDSPYPRDPYWKRHIVLVEKR